METGTIKSVVEKTVSSSWAIDRYEAVRSRLPSAGFPKHSAVAASLDELKGQFDVFVFDSFGVLNVGETPISGACARVEALRRAGKQLFVLTNAATVPLGGLVQKYAGLGFQFANREIVSSRELLATGMQSYGDDWKWGVAAPHQSNVHELPGQCRNLVECQHVLDDFDGFVLLSSSGWSDQLQAMLVTALQARPRPLLVGNPDVVAPREDGLTLEPGAFAHEIADVLKIAPKFYGKPFGNAFDEIESRLESAIKPHRIAMIGDSFHTDILGGAAAGWRTVLVADHGLVKGHNIAEMVNSTGIVPDFIIPSI